MRRALGGTKIGPGAVPIKTKHGWLTIFHGVRTQCAQHYVYQLGVCRLDLADPSRAIRLCEEAILEPEEPYELVGQTPSVVFTSGAVSESDGTVKVITVVLIPCSASLQRPSIGCCARAA
jgi:predicted GH43/DUF377 family glycosyl hydrolase